jgi:hypothetical protein
MKSRVQVRRSSGRKFVWARAEAATAAVAPGGFQVTSALAVFETVLGASLIGATITRVRGVICMIPTITASTTALRGRMGMRVDPKLGTSTVTDGVYGSEHGDWMAWWPLQCGAGAVNTIQTGQTSCREVDVRSMRRLDELDETLDLWFGAPAGNATNVSFVYDLSIGIKLP